MKLYRKIIIFPIIILFIGANIIPIINGNTEQKLDESVIIVLYDELDQYQNNSDEEYQIYKDQYIAQTFIPTLNILTRIKVLIRKTIDITIPDLFVQIENKNMENIGFSSLKSSELSDEFNWYEFDFIPDINVGDTYSMILYSYGEELECYEVSCSIYNDYDQGAFFISSNGISWNPVDNVDLCFETYGFEEEPPENNPPNKPTIIGPVSGKTGEEYEYSIVSTDPEGDDVSYCIDWGDGTPELCNGPYASGVEQTFSHIWNEEDTYVIRVKARDTNGAESDWATLEVSMPKQKIISQIPKILSWLFEHFSILQSYF